MPRRSRISSSILKRPTENIEQLYHFGRCLGKGQFGTTYLCIEKHTLKEYACKVISKRKLLFTEDANDVMREIQILHHLSGQPSIVEIEGTYEDERNVYLVMELCSGGELFERIVSRGHYSEQQARNLIRTIVNVVETCHSLGVMHRDLKPENFLFAGPEENAPLKAIDFGLSIFFQPGRIYDDLVGSPYYVAPEVLHRAYGPEADIWSVGVILYILLSGLPPFWADTDQGIFDQIRKSNLEFNPCEWSDISESAKELIRNMLNPDPSERFTAYQVHCHPWISEDGIAPDHPLDPIILSRMKKFMLMNKIKKIAMQIIAQKLSEEEIAGLKEIFKMLDEDNSGTITFQELKAGLEKLGCGLTDSEVQNIMEATDLDNSGSIDYKEFLAATLNHNMLEKEENLLVAFSYFDKDRSGYITVDELQQACLEHRVVAADITKIIEEVDQNQDGRVDYSEFVAMMRKENGGLSRRYSWNSIMRTY